MDGVSHLIRSTCTQVIELKERERERKHTRDEVDDSYLGDMDFVCVELNFTLSNTL